MPGDDHRLAFSAIFNHFRPYRVIFGHLQQLSPNLVRQIMPTRGKAVRDQGGLWTSAKLNVNIPIKKEVADFCRFEAISMQIPSYHAVRGGIYLEVFYIWVLAKNRPKGCLYFGGVSLAEPTNDLLSFGRVFSTSDDLYILALLSNFLLKKVQGARGWELP